MANHLNNILFSGTVVDGKRTGKLTIVDLDDLSEHGLHRPADEHAHTAVWKRFSDTMTSAKSALQYAHLASLAAYQFVEEYLSLPQAQQTATEWTSRMNHALISA